MEKIKEVIFLKGKESAFVGILLVLALIVFIVPIVLVMILRAVFRIGQTIKQETQVTLGVNPDLENAI